MQIKKLNYKRNLEKLSLLFILIILIVHIIKLANSGQWLATDLLISFKIDAGSRALPSEVIAIKKILTRHPSSKFNLSDDFKADGLIFQRSSEYLYPVRLDDSSQLIFASKADKFFFNCTLIDEESNIGLYKCQN